MLLQAAAHIIPPNLNLKAVNSNQLTALERGAKKFTFNPFGSALYRSL